VLEQVIGVPTIKTHRKRLLDSMAALKEFLKGFDVEKARDVIAEQIENSPYISEQEKNQLDKQLEQAAFEAMAVITAKAEQESRDIKDAVSIKAHLDGLNKLIKSLESSVRQIEFWDKITILENIKQGLARIEYLIGFAKANNIRLSVQKASVEKLRAKFTDTLMTALAEADDLVKGQMELNKKENDIYKKHDAFRALKADFEKAEGLLKYLLEMTVAEDLKIKIGHLHKAMADTQAALSLALDPADIQRRIDHYRHMLTLTGISIDPLGALNAIAGILSMDNDKLIESITDLIESGLIDEDIAAIMLKEAADLSQTRLADAEKLTSEEAEKELSRVRFYSDAEKAKEIKDLIRSTTQQLRVIWDDVMKAHAADKARRNNGNHSSSPVVMNREQMVQAVNHFLRFEVGSLLGKIRANLEDQDERERTRRNIQERRTGIPLINRAGLFRKAFCHKAWS
jgi:hypothetical protein